jgi:hypothetical protein
MGDHSNETLQFQKRRDEEKYARDRILGGVYLNLDQDTINWILNHIDCFDSQARLNESIGEVVLYPYPDTGQDIEVWDKVGKAIGNLQSLKRLGIDTFSIRGVSTFRIRNQVKG